MAPSTASKTVFYFVRHGETEYNRRRIVQGRRINSVLNETGQAQAEALAQRFSKLPLGVIYTSPMRRAVQTAQALSRAHPRVPVVQHQGLEEMSWGIYEGEPPSPEMKAVFSDMYARWDRGEFGYRVEEGESILDVQARALDALEYMLERHQGDTVAVVAHGRLLRVLLASVLRDYGLERMHEIRHANTCVNRLTYVGGRFEADLLNCTAHLDAVETTMVE